MGPSPESVARVRSIGVSAWIDEQVKKPVSRITTPTDLIDFDQVLDQARNNRAGNHHNLALIDQAVGADDQLRYRTVWVLSNFLVASTRKINAIGGSEYWNTLMDGAFGQFGDLLRAISLSPAMGHYLDNSQNNRFSLNENYGRELMQLFSVGMVQLNLDGSVKRDAAGKPIETYTQKDVIEATRALTGWRFTPNPLNETIRSNHNFANYQKPMVAQDPNHHDRDAKVVLGKTIPAGGDASRDLDALITILVDHPNTAPFVSFRLIQGLTTSDPSPAYIRRVATVFQQTRGNLSSVVKAILTDPDARAADQPGSGSNAFGRIREPFLQHVGIMRGLGCKIAIRDRNSPERAIHGGLQRPLNAESVFNFYPPNHRAPGSNLLAPEQKTLINSEFQPRLGRYNWQFREESILTQAGCEVEAFKRAIASSDDALLDMLSLRFYRGAMPPATRQGLKDALASQPWRRDIPTELLGVMLQFAAVTPSLGAIK